MRMRVQWLAMAILAASALAQTPAGSVSTPVKRPEAVVAGIPANYEEGEFLAAVAASVTMDLHPGITGPVWPATNPILADSRFGRRLPRKEKVTISRWA